jgi:hypothetical protein
VLLYFLDNVFRLDLSLETPESVFQGLTLLNNNFRHAYSPPSPERFGFALVMQTGTVSAFEDSALPPNPPGNSGQCKRRPADRLRLINHENNTPLAGMHLPLPTLSIGAYP